MTISQHVIAFLRVAYYISRVETLENKTQVTICIHIMINDTDINGIMRNIWAVILDDKICI